MLDCFALLNALPFSSSYARSTRAQNKTIGAVRLTPLTTNGHYFDALKASLLCSGFLRRAAQANAIACKSSRSRRVPRRTQAALHTLLKPACFALDFFVELRGAWANVLTSLGGVRLSPPTTKPC
jgi:hypothetical protein